MTDPIRLIACSCQRSAMFPVAPIQHCPGCHKTWREQKLTALVHCPHCGFNMMRPRQIAEGRTWGRIRSKRLMY
jgi:DNA-directed RNA polymerase subunit RPC12/RpoP